MNSKLKSRVASVLIAAGIITGGAVATAPAASAYQTSATYYQMWPGKDGYGCYAGRYYYYNPFENIFLGKRNGYVAEIKVANWYCGR